jgi:hypothetical protein
MKPLVLSIAIVMVYAPVAYAAKFTGRTSQDRRAVVVTEGGEPARITIMWRARCGEGYAPLSDGTSFLPPFEESTTTYVREDGPYTTQIRDKQGRTYRVEVNVRMRARRVTRSEWRGRFRVVEAEIRRNGRVVTRCSTRRLRWHATR